MDLKIAPLFMVLVLGCLLVAGCGEGGDDTVSLRFHALAGPQDPVTDASLDDAADAVRERANRFGLDVNVSVVSNAQQLEITAAEPVGDEIVEDLIRPFRIAGYAYEDSLVGSPLATFEAAVMRAQRAPVIDGARGERAYVLSADKRQFGPLAGELVAADAIRASGEGGLRVVSVPRGYAIVETAERLAADTELTQSQFHILRGAPAFSSSDIERAWVQETAAPGGPSVDVLLDFTAAGSARFEGLTAEIGQESRAGGADPTFAIVIDHELVSRATVSAEFSGGITEGRVRIAGQWTRDQAERVASALSSTPLPRDLVIVDPR